MHRLFIVPVLIFSAVLFAPGKLNAAPEDNMPPPADDVATPLDGGLSILAGAAIAYGYKKHKDQQQKDREGTGDN